MFQLSYDIKTSMVTAETTGTYDAAIAKEQMHQIIELPNLNEKLRVLRIFKHVTFGLSVAEVNEHFTYVQHQLNHTHIKKCYLAVVTEVPINTALGFLYQSNETTGSCNYAVKVFSTEEAAIKWLMEN